MAVDIYGNIITDTGEKTGGTVNLTTGEVTSQNLVPTGNFTTFPAPTLTDYSGAIDTNIQSLLQAYQTPSQEETTQNDLQKMIMSSLGTLGTEASRQQSLEQEAGLPQQRSELQSVIGQLQTLQKEAQAIPLQVQQESFARGRTAAGVAPITTGRLRENAIEALRLSAIGQTLQGNISLAESNIQNALRAEFEPERNKLQQLSLLYQFNQDALKRVDSKRAQALEFAITERNRVLELQQAEREGIYNIGSLAAQYGADATTIQRIFNANNRGEAIALAGGYLQDPLAKQQLQNSLLDSQLKKLQIQREAAELELFQRYGGLSPTEWLKMRQEEIDAATKEGDETQLAKEQIRDIDTNISQIDAILNSSALDTVVGTTFLTRGIARQKEGFLGKLAKFTVSGAGLLGGGYLDELGKADDTVALTEQLISQQFLDKLISSKGQGATFGQLSDREGAALRAAANAIGATAIRDDNDKVIGYDMSEKLFREQLGVIQERLQYARQKWGGNLFTDEENSILDSLESTQGLFFNPMNYYGI